ncbi:MAG: hypothetical protein AB7U81_02665 [Thiohalomonadaceae bacterium]
MTQHSFEIVFNGVIVPGSDPAQVKRNLAAMFKTEVAKVEPLFSGRRFVIKKGLDQATALKYQKALREAGAIVQVENPAAAAATAESPAAPAATPTVPAPATPAPAAEGGLQATIDPPGVVLVEPEKVVPPVIDTSGLSLDPPGVTLVAPAAVADLDVNLSGLTMAEPGVVLVEHPKVADLAVDTSAMTMAEPGVQLVEHAPVSAPDIDTSKLSLE